METKLIKKLILQTIDQNDGHCSWADIDKNVSRNHWLNKLSIPTGKQITHVAYLLEKDDAVEKISELHVGIFYRLTPWGHALLGPWHKKLGYFLVYKNNNLISLIALIFSLIALILSDRIWTWLSVLF